ncbi:dTMP kinase [Mollicutes bacterium LVI A0039]|nr:dTMP kinase [Mollicutes bacterium LVI A0039]
MLKKFITIEGGEGCGKSTLCLRLNEMLNELNIDHIITREPGGIKASEEMREIIFGNILERKSEVLLFAAARNEHLLQKIIPALESGKLVICDRYVDSSLAYQGYAQGLGIDEVLNINQYVIGDNFPHITFWLDMEVEEALARITNEREINHYDQKAVKFHEDVRAGYQILMERYPERFIKLDATKSIDELAKIVIEKLICLK